VRAALDLDALVDALAAGYGQLSAGAVSAPPRTAVQAGATVLLMGAHRRGAALATVKLVSLRKGDADAAPTHHAVIVAFDATSGPPRAILDGEAITAARTAATTRLAVRRLAAPGAGVLAVIGAGVQARAHLEALHRERTWREVRVAARRPERARTLAGLFGARAMPGIAEAAAGADVVCLATAATAPVVEAAPPGVLVCSVGYGGGEVGRGLVAAARVVVEARAAALAPPPAGAPELAGVREAEELGELGEGARHDPERPTLFKSVGVALADDVATELVLRAAEARGLGARARL